MGRRTVVVALTAAFLSGGVPAPAQEVQRESAPEFTYDSATDRALVARIRQRAGTTNPPAIRLEGTLQWRGADESQRWGVTLRWPVLYQQRTANVIHTLEHDAYRTNAGTPSSVHEVARENVRNRFGDTSLLLLARPHVSGMAIKSEGTATVDGMSARKLVVRNHLGPWLTLYVHPTEDRIVASGRPWTVDNESVEQLTIVRERRRVGSTELPTRMEQVTGKHVAVIKVEPVIGSLATTDP